MNKKTLNKKKALYGALGFGALIAVALPIFAGAGAGGGCREKGHGFGKLYGMSMMNDRMNHQTFPKTRSRNIPTRCVIRRRR